MRTSVLLISVVFTLAIGILPQEAQSLKCYVCNSFKHKQDCGHGKDVSDDYLIDCDSQKQEDGGIQGAKYQFCRKIISTIDFDVNNNTAVQRITRTCGYLESAYDESCYYRAGFGGRQTTCSCKEDGCNSGFTFGVNSILMSLAFLATLMRFKC